MIEVAPTQEQAQSEREQYVRAWNDTMIKIWQERITLLDVIDTGRLLQSPCTIPIQADGRFVELTISEQNRTRNASRKQGRYRSNKGAPAPTLVLKKILLLRPQPPRFLRRKPWSRVPRYHGGHV